jgi:hypothetical protein
VRRASACNCFPVHLCTHKGVQHALVHVNMVLMMQGC